MFQSTLDLFKIGIGPSSSHTVGPMVAAGRFLQVARQFPEGRRLTVNLFGSLAYTGVGHGTDRAVELGLCDLAPADAHPDRAEPLLEEARQAAQLVHADLAHIAFDRDEDLVLRRGETLPGHPNAMTFSLSDTAGAEIASETYYSVGGGFVLTEAEMGHASIDDGPPSEIPYPFASAEQMLAMGQAADLSIAAMKRANECATMDEATLNARLDAIWASMAACIDHGLSQDGILPGGLKVKRRAAEIHAKLQAEHGSNAVEPHQIVDWVSVYAMAVNEENAAGGLVVTAPTNGAAGVIPAVIRYYLDHTNDGRPELIGDFLLTAAAIGGIIKHNASIAGAEVGCQGEVGSASAMAAAGLAAVLGGTNEQIENAAEIALEHHLGMTCDPVSGLVQVPCIERNALGAVKAITAASLALRGDGTHLVHLDQCIETMRQTGDDMNHHYKETSLGGLAVNVVEC